jgi:hypothetical protein
MDDSSKHRRIGVIILQWRSLRAGHGNGHGCTSPMAQIEALKSAMEEPKPSRGLTRWVEAGVGREQQTLTLSRAWPRNSSPIENGQAGPFNKQDF